MQRSFVFLCTFLLQLILVSASWSITYYNYPNRVDKVPMVSEQQIAFPAYAQIVLTHVDDTGANQAARFDDRTMPSDRTIFPGTCVSSSQNAYGWNYWKKQLFTGGITPVSVNGASITITLAGNEAFSPTENETVTCYPNELGSKGTSYLKSGVLSAEDSAVSFNIMRTPLAPRISLQMKLLAATKDLSQREAIIRMNGFHLSIYLANDVWDPSVESKLIAGLSCAPSGADCTWFMNMIKTPSYRGFNATRPNQYYFYVPPDDMRLVNFVNDFTVTLTLDDRTFRYGLKSGFTVTFISSDSFVTITRTSPVQYVSMRTTTAFAPGGLKSSTTIVKNVSTYTITESCLRGKVVPKTSDCSGVMFVDILESDAVSRSIVISPANAANMRNMNDTGIYSKNLGQYLPIFNSVSSAYAELNLFLTYYTGIAFFLMSATDYDISATDTLTIRLPYNHFSNNEPAAAANPLTITVTPSAGEVREYTLPNIAQDSLWRGGNKLMIRLGGESFLPSTPSIFLSFMSGSFAGISGWNAYINCTANASNGKPVYFAKRNVTINGVRKEIVDNQTIVVDLFTCPAYLMDAGTTETVSIAIPSTSLASGIALTSQTMLQFTVTKSPGMYTVSGVLDYLEHQVLGGEVTFEMSFMGGEYAIDPILDPTGWNSCVTALVDAWGSSTADVNGWSNRAARVQLLNNSLTRVSATRLRFKFSNSTIYDTRRGELINISSMPGQCFLSGVKVYATTKSYISVKPMRGTVTLGYQYPSQAVVWQTNITESMMRRGNFYWVVGMEGDTFDDEKQTNFGTAVAYASLTTDSLEPGGFNFLKSSLITPTKIEYEPLERKTIRIWINPTVKFDVRNDEVVTVGVSADWTTSQQEVTNTPGSMTFTILKSAGDIQLEDWYGKNREVTEKDIRDGKVWFRFGLLGDQWRAERPPYLTAFTSNETSPTAFTALVEQIVPSIEFFSFTSGEAYEYLTITLQSSDLYDISRDEVLVVAFPGTTVVSDLAPTFSGDGVVNGRQYITIKVVAGNVVLSGMTKLNEKQVRQGGVALFLTLFGEQWISNAASATLCVRRAISSSLMDTLFNTTLLPISSGGDTTLERESPHVIVIPFESDRTKTYTYDIASAVVDVLTISSLSACVQSKIEPERRPLQVIIQPTEGELRLDSLIPSVVSEVTLRSVGLTIKIQLDGDSWSSNATSPDKAVQLVAGLGSLSSSITEPNGFYANRQSLLGISATGGSPTVRIDQNTLEIDFSPTPNYNIDSDETITFSVPGAQYVTGGVLPSPSTISFTVTAITRGIVLIIDASRPDSMKGGSFDLDNLRSKIADVLSCLDSTRITVRLNATRSDGLLVILLSFTGSVSAVETRTNGALGTIFTGYSTSYLDTKAGIKNMYWEDIGAAASNAGSSSGGNAASGGSSDGDGMDKAVWGIVAAGCIIVVVGGYFVVMYFRQSELGGQRRGAHIPMTDRYGVIQGEEEGEEEYSGSFAGSRSFSGRQSPPKTNIIASLAKSAWSRITGKRAGGPGRGGNAGRPRSLSKVNGQSGRNSAVQYKHATRMFEQKLRDRQKLSAHHSDNDPSNPALVPNDPLIDRPMSLKEYAHKRSLANNPDTRVVQDIIDSARQRLQAADEEEAEANLIDDVSGFSRNITGADIDDESSQTARYSNAREERRQRLAFAEDILLKRQREDAERAARERANRHVVRLGGAGEEDEELYGVDGRRKATQARIEQMMEGFS